MNGGEGRESEEGGVSNEREGDDLGFSIEE